MMRPSPIIRSVSFAAAGALLGLLAPSGSASAAPPSADQFQIIYYVTDGDQQRIMTANELKYWSNQARCECGAEIEARIRLQGSFDNVQVRTFVGTRCDDALQVVGQFDPCVRALDEFANAYTKTSSVFFDPVWLTSGVADRNNDTLESATPATACDAGTGMGGGGIWICVESNNTSDCQPEEFIIKGSQNNNPSGSDDMDTGSVPGMMGGGGGGSLQADFQPPSITVTGFRATGGDGGVEIAWDQVSTTDVNGFRVLCADASGNPVPGKGITPSTNDQNLGTVYFTADNLCPGDAPPGGGGTDGGGTDGTSTSGGTGEATGGGTQGAIQGDHDPQHGGFPATTSGGGTITATDSTTTATGGGTGGDTDGTGGFTTGTSLTSGGTGGGGGTMADFGGPKDTLDWEYVCSDHVPPMSSSVRVSGLDNGKEYQFIVVAYDRAGNPATASEVLTAIPQETTDLWEQCAEQGDICGNGGFCSCRTGPARSDGVLWMVLGLTLGIARRRRWRLAA